MYAHILTWTEQNAEEIKVTTKVSASSHQHHQQQPTTARETSLGAGRNNLHMSSAIKKVKQKKCKKPRNKMFSCIYSWAMSSSSGAKMVKYFKIQMMIGQTIIQFWHFDYKLCLLLPLHSLLRPEQQHSVSSLLIHLKRWKFQCQVTLPLQQQQHFRYFAARFWLTYKNCIYLHWCANSLQHLLHAAQSNSCLVLTMFECGERKWCSVDIVNWDVFSFCIFCIAILFSFFFFVIFGKCKFIGMPS